MKLLSSPRVRRRLAYLGAVPLAAGAVALGAALAPGRKGVLQHFSHAPVQRVTVPRQVPLTDVERTGIDATLDRFVPGAIQRRAPRAAAAWTVSTRALRGGTTSRQWARGDVPVYPYPARGRWFHNWALQYSFRNRVGIELGLSPRRGAKVGAAAYEVDLKHVRGAWLVDSIYLRAIYPP